MPDREERITYVPGLTAHTTPRGIRILEIDYWANPSHNEAWATSARRLYASNKDWRREMDRDWSTPAGDPYFPEFSENGEQLYLEMARRMIKSPVVRSLDFGRRKPACTWFQYSQPSDRIWLYREFMPADLGAHDFADAIKYLSGEIPIDQLAPKARAWVEAYAARPTGSHCPPPWFPLGTRFINIAGKEANQTQANVPEDAWAVTRDLFAHKGIELLIVSPGVFDRNQKVRRFLRVRDDGRPGLIIDPQCEEMIEGFSGAFSYPAPTAAVPVPVKPKDDGHFINLLDAFGYGVFAVSPTDTPEPAEHRILRFDINQKPIYARAEEVIDCYENRRR